MSHKYCILFDSVARGFATWKIRHKEDSPHNGWTYKCDREFESKRRTNVCNSADVDDSPRNDDRLGSGRVGLRGLRLGGGGGVGGGQSPDPPTSTP